MSSDVSKSEAEGQENDSYQQDCDGDELCAVKGKGKSGFKGTGFKCGMRAHKADAGRKERVKEERGIGKKEKEDTKERVDPKERDGPRESGQIQVTRGTIRGVIPIGTARRMVWRLIRGRLLNLFPISVQSV